MDRKSVFSDCMDLEVLSQGIIVLHLVIQYSGRIKSKYDTSIPN